MRTEHQPAPVGPIISSRGVRFSVGRDGFALTCKVRLGLLFPLCAFLVVRDTFWPMMIRSPRESLAPFLIRRKLAVAPLSMRTGSKATTNHGNITTHTFDSKSELAHNGQVDYTPLMLASTRFPTNKPISWLGALF